MSDQETQWSYCPQLKSACLLAGSKESLGSDIYDAFVAFVLGDDAGGRLVLERTADSFTLNLTDSVRRGSREPVDVNALQAMQERLASRGVDAS